MISMTITMIMTIIGVRGITRIHPVLLVVAEEINAPGTWTLSYPVAAGMIVIVSYYPYPYYSM